MDGAHLDVDDNGKIINAEERSSNVVVDKQQGQSSKDGDEDLATAAAVPIEDGGQQQARAF